MSRGGKGKEEEAALKVESKERREKRKGGSSPRKEK